MDQIICVKGVAWSDEPRENYHRTVFSLSVFYIIVLVLWITAFLFWFSLIALISIVISQNWFQGKKANTTTHPSTKQQTDKAR